MMRLCLLPMLLLACSGEQRHVSKFRMPHGGTCPEDKGCEAPLATEPQYANPDSSRPVHDPSSVPLLVGGKAPEPTCSLVAEEIASLQIGNYADESERAPLVAKHEANCRRQALTLEERQCIVDAFPLRRHQWGQAKEPAMMAYCAARMFPDVPAVQLVPMTKCDEIAAEVRARLPQGWASEAGPRREWEARMDVLTKSCHQDRWTAPFGACVRSAAGTPEPMAHCFALAPHALELKISERTQKALRAITGAR